MGDLFVVGLVVIGASIVVFVAMYVITRGDQSVLPTVSDDPSLPRIELNGTTFHAEAFGDEARPVVIVLHGGPGGDYRSLESLRRLPDAFRVVFYDQRGSGLSARVPAEQITYDTALADLDAFVDHFSPGRRVHLIGHSWGGTLVAGYLGMAPEKVDRAVMAEPGYLTSEEAADWRWRYAEIVGGWQYRWVALRSGFEAQHVSGPDTHAKRDFLIGDRMIPYFADHPDNPYHCPGRSYDAPRWRWGSTASDALASQHIEADLDATVAANTGYDGPLLFLASECNTWIGADLQAKHAASYPGAEVSVIAGSGHDVFWDAPDEALAVVRGFLDVTLPS